MTFLDLFQKHAVAFRADDPALAAFASRNGFDDLQNAAKGGGPRSWSTCAPRWPRPSLSPPCAAFRPSARSRRLRPAFIGTTITWADRTSARRSDS